MKILKQKPIVLLNDCNAVYDNDLLIEAMLWFASDPMEKTKKVFMYGRYPAVAIGKHKLHIHRLIVAYENDGLGPQFYVHHKDGNRLNAERKNLEIMRADEHQSITNKGRKQSPEWIKKRIAKTADAKRGKKYPKKVYENPELLTPSAVDKK